MIPYILFFYCEPLELLNIYFMAHTCNGIIIARNNADCVLTRNLEFSFFSKLVVGGLVVKLLSAELTSE